MYTRELLGSHLRQLGLAPGDIVLARAALRSLGPVEGNPARVLIDALLDVVGEHGTLLGLSHTAASKWYRRSPAVFSRATPCITGGFAAALLDWPGAYRSSHPTNSMVAIGRDAEALLREHDEHATCFAPMRALVDRGGKQLLVGCTESSPGFSTVHLVYEDLHLAEHNITRGLYGSYYERAGVRWFAKRDVPGCSMGFGNLYDAYRQQGLLRAGNVGDALTYMIDARDAYAVEHAEISRDPRCALCTRPDCLSCRGTHLFDVPGMLKFYARRPRQLPHLVEAAVSRLLV